MENNLVENKSSGNKAVLLVDGQNFLKYISRILRSKGNIGENEAIDWSFFDFQNLFSNIFEDTKITEKIFYLSKIVKYEETKQKSEYLIRKNRLLKTQLESQGFEVVVAGKVRGYFQKDREGKVLSADFHEKGVDVRLAVDMVKIALLDKQANKIIFASSDSDINPAIRLIKSRSSLVELIYLCFSRFLNKGISYIVSGETITIRDNEVLENYRPTKKLA